MFGLYVLDYVCVVLFWMMCAVLDYMFRIIYVCCYVLDDVLCSGSYVLDKVMHYVPNDVSCSGLCVVRTLEYV